MEAGKTDAYGRAVSIGPPGENASQFTIESFAFLPSLTLCPDFHETRPQRVGVENHRAIRTRESVGS